MLDYQFFDAEMAYPEGIDVAPEDEVWQIVVDGLDGNVLVVRLDSGEPIVYMDLNELSETENDSLVDHLRQAVGDWCKNIRPTLPRESEGDHEKI